MWKQTTFVLTVLIITTNNLGKHISLFEEVESNWNFVFSKLISFSPEFASVFNSFPWSVVLNLSWICTIRILEIHSRFLYISLHVFVQCKLDAYQFQNANEHNDCVDFMQNSQTVVNLMRKVKISHTKINNKKTNQTIGLLNTAKFAELGNQLSHWNTSSN